MSEEWRSIKGYEGIYDVSSYGRVRNNKRTVKHSRGGSQILQERILKQFLINSGYLCVTLCYNAVKKQMTVHSIVACAFIGERPEGMDVDHIDRDRIHNFPDNLRYISRSQNCQNNDAHLHCNRYINIQRGFYVVRKRVNGKHITFSRRTKNLEEAITMRDKLEMNNWIL